MVLEQSLIDAVRSRGGRITPQRLVLLRELRRQPQHVTAESLLDAVTPQLPGVSLATVYATLELLEELGMTRRVPMPGGVTVFDSRTDPHHHTRCRRCGAVHDLDAPLATDTAVAAAARVGFHADEATLTLTGVCAACQP